MVTPGADRPTPDYGERLDAWSPPATAHTLSYDWAALGEHTMYGAPLNPEGWAAVTARTLVVYGAKSPEVLQQGSRVLGMCCRTRSCGSSGAGGVAGPDRADRV